MRRLAAGKVYTPIVKVYTPIVIVSRCHATTYNFNISAGATSVNNFFFFLATFFGREGRQSRASIPTVEMGGLEPPTSWLQTTRSPSELHPQRLNYVTPSQWAYLDSNQGPQLYQSCALAN